MVTHGSHAFAHARVWSPTRDRNFERELARFDPKLRDSIRALAGRHVRLAELSESFPALLVALAWPRAGFNPKPVIAGVVAGSPLASLAVQAGVPLWLRGMRPEMLPAPLPRLPDSPFLRHRIVNHFPTHRKRAAEWFRSVSFAGEWVNEDFALWCAKAYVRPVPRRRGRRFLSLRLVGLWAWHSAQRNMPGSAFIVTPFNPEMKFMAAATAAIAWQERVELELLLGGQRIKDIWLEPGTADGFDFVPLRDAAAIDEEAAAMQHCVRTYAANVANNTSRIWSIRRDGQRVATLQLKRGGNERVPGIGQVRLVYNDDPSHQVWAAAHRWLRGQEVRELDAEDCIWRPAVPDRRRWQAFWKPYWLEKQRAPGWLPFVPTSDTLCYL